MSPGTGRVLDTAAILDIAQGHSQYGQAIITFALKRGMILALPATALAEAWATAPAGGRPFLAALTELPVAVLEPLDAPAAVAVGLLAAERSASVDGTVQAVEIALRRGWAVITGDPDALLAIDPKIGFESIP